MHQPCCCAAGRAEEEEEAAVHVALSLLRHPNINSSAQEQKDEQKGEVIPAIAFILNLT